MPYRFVTVDVFTDRIFGGNPLAVFPDAAGLTSAEMQSIATEWNLSETVFLFPPRDPRHTAAARIFTPAHELAFAGHPTLGAAFVLAIDGRIDLAAMPTDVILEEQVGLVRVRFTVAGGAPDWITFTAPRLPESGPEPPSSADLSRMLSLNSDDLASDRHPAAFSCGVPFLFIPVRDRDALARARLVEPVWQSTLADFWAPSVYVVTPDTDSADGRLRARMFAPAHGVREDPATGSAGAAVAGYLADEIRDPDGSRDWTIQQGVEMGRPSTIKVSATKRAGMLASVSVSGQAVRVSAGELYL